ncbi:uncharacterized protein B0P05DRAFT_565403, partial [Gilbertella persicaria]|uniref:uncharacterized protein n=1 Tax=Gilbertella persicaria TaxID=101096 RepID=UPI0022205746
MSLFFSIQRASIHSSRILATEWTKASLRRMKKPELINLAKENHLDVSGTKNDIIIKLLTHQTAKVVGSTAPSISSIQRVAEQKKQHDSPNSDTQYKNIGSIIEQDSSQPSEPHPLSDAVSKTIKQQDDDKMNQDWVNAFDMKVAQRRSNRKLFSAPNQPSRPHPLDDAIKPKMKPKAVPEIVVNHSKEKNIKAPILTSSSETIDINELEGIDPRWVEAFELKVGSRDKKH